MSKKLKAGMLTALAAIVLFVSFCLCLVFPVLLPIVMGGVVLYSVVMFIYSMILDCLDD